MPPAMTLGKDSRSLATDPDPEEGDPCGEREGNDFEDEAWVAALPLGGSRPNLTGIEEDGETCRTCEPCDADRGKEDGGGTVQCRGAEGITHDRGGSLTSKARHPCSEKGSNCRAADTNSEDGEGSNGVWAGGRSAWERHHSWDKGGDADGGGEEDQGEDGQADHSIAVQ